MRYQITPRMQSLLVEIAGLVSETQPWLGLVSPDARAEWEKLRDRLPGADDLRRRLVLLSEREIEDVCSKFRRFRQIVSTAQPQLRPASGYLPASIGGLPILCTNDLTRDPATRFA